VVKIAISDRILARIKNFNLIVFWMKLMSDLLIWVMILAVIALPILGPILGAALGQRFSESVRVSLFLTGCLTAVCTYYYYSALYRTVFNTIWIYRGMCFLQVPVLEYMVALYSGVFLVSLAKLFDWTFKRDQVERKSLLWLGAALTACLVIGFDWWGSKILPKILDLSCGPIAGLIFQSDRV
jgi:hypothetical protein